MLERAAAAVLLFVTVLSANRIALTSRSVADAGFIEGRVELVRRAGVVWKWLGAHPSAFAADGEQPGIFRSPVRSGVLPYYCTGDADGELIVARLKGDRVPIALT